MANRTVCIFAGARGNSYLFPDSAWLGAELARAGWDIIYGGSNKGVMGAVSRAAKGAGGRVIGVLPEKVYQLNHYNSDIEVLVAKTMAERKQHFWDRSDAFLCLPGAYGSMDELFEVLTLTKLGYLEPKPIVVFNQMGFYDALQDMVCSMVDHGTMDKGRASIVQFSNKKENALQLVTCQAVGQVAQGNWRF